MTCDSSWGTSVIALAFDTSSQVASVALRAGDRLLSRAERVSTSSERLLPIIDDLFREAGVAPSALALVACAAGPGSFTGLRIGLSTAKGLCLATGARLVMVPTLRAIADGAGEGTRVVAAIDAYRGELYAGAFTIEGGAPRAVSVELAAFAVKPEALAAALGVWRPSHYAGEGFTKFATAIPPGAAALDRPRPLAEAVLRLAELDGEAIDPRHAAPLYVRPPAPEEKLK
jgi:tRNA threonylcarbamoyladenosine biosynthesis protein TsaB